MIFVKPICALALAFLGRVDAAARDWKVLNGLTMYRNTSFFIKGVNWFGAETCKFAPHGMDHHPMSWYMDFQDPPLG